jgi:integrase
MALFQRGHIWWYEFQFEGRRIRESTGLTNKAAARRAEEKRKVDLAERRASIDRPKRPPRFDEYIPGFLSWSQQQHRPKTYELHKLNCATLSRYFGTKWLDEITPGMVEDFKLARIREPRRNANDGSTISAATVNRALTTLKLVFKHAKRYGLAVTDATADVAHFEEDPGRTRIMSPLEEAAYFKAASQPLHDVARVILDTGLRPEEVFRIEVGNVDFIHRTISIPYGKTRAARRTIPMTEQVWMILKNRAVAARGCYLFASPKDPTRPVKSVRKGHDRAVERAGISEPLRLYDLRHTFASRAAMSGMDPFRLAALIGHTTIQMTSRYVHVGEADKRRAVAELEEFNRLEAENAVERWRESPQESPQ